MEADYDKAFEITVGVEAGYVNDPKDPGGETNWGVTLPVLKAAVSADLIAYVTLKDLTKEQAKIIYKKNYWDEVKGDQLPFPLCAFVFDAAVNQGVLPARKMLQQVLKVPQTGILDVPAMTKAKGSSLWHAQAFMSQRALRYIGTRNFDNYGNGWFTRLFIVCMEASK